MAITLDEYLNNLAERFARYYDVSWNEEIAGQRSYDLVARFKMRNEKYFFVRGFTLFAYENHEIALVKAHKSIDEPAAEQFGSVLKELVPFVVRPSEEHMSTVLTGVLVAEDGVLPTAASLVERFRYSRNFRWLLQGWCEVRFLAVDLASGQVYSNKAGRAVKEAYRLPAAKEGRERLVLPPGVDVIQTS